jgi:hypothetical protein
MSSHTSCIIANGQPIASFVSHIRFCRRFCDNASASATRDIVKLARALAKYVRPYSKGQKNDFRDAEAIAEAVQVQQMKFVATKTTEQLDLQGCTSSRDNCARESATNLPVRSLPRYGCYSCDGVHWHP